MQVPQVLQDIFSKLKENNGDFDKIFATQTEILFLVLMGAEITRNSKFTSRKWITEVKIGDINFSCVSDKKLIG